MFSALYFEKSLRDHTRVQEILDRYPQLPQIECAHYGEIFNRSAQNFRLQKQAPALILAEKRGQRVLPAPSGYGFHGGRSYYFSHMLNCLYDCRYCFLQGMYRSAHYVLFVNYEDFAQEIITTCRQQKQPCIFYSGYDCDSLAMEPVSYFTDFFLPVFRELEGATLELRSKSTQVRQLLKHDPIANCVVAMSFSSERAGKRWEHKVPDLAKRLDVLSRLQLAGWPIALRFEPVIPEAAALEDYERLFAKLFAVLDAGQLHSVSIGEFRMPRPFHKRIAQLYPDEPLYAAQTIARDGLLSLEAGDALISKLEARLLEYIVTEQYYRCAADA